MAHGHTAGRAVTRRRAFTLIEIAVVVAIVCILAAILLPVFGSAREAGRSATCSSNLKQISLAINQYVQDSGGYYPQIDGVAGNPPSSTDGCTWSARVYPYLKSAEVLMCPSFESGEFREGCPSSEKVTDSSTQGNTWDGSYDLVGGGGIRDARNSAGMVSLVRIRKPSQRILSFDGHGIETAFEVLDDAKRQEAIDQGYARHQGALNALFFDGHVKRIPFDDITTKTFWE